MPVSNSESTQCQAYLCPNEAQNYLCNGRYYCLDHVIRLLQIRNEKPE